MNITLIRHTSVDVPSGTCYGQTDVPLKPTFAEEAEAVKEALVGCRFDKVFSSPLSRCTRLAAFCGHEDAQRDNRLKEMNFGEWEMQRFDEISDPRIQQWYEDYFNVAATGGESFMDMSRRVTAFFEELRLQPYNEVAIFTHGGVILQTLLVLGRVQKENLFDHQPSYGGIVTITI